MAATDKPKPHGLVEYLVHGTKDADKRVSQQEIDRQTGPWIPATLLNSYAAPSAPMGGVKYRLDFKTDSLEFSGHIDVSGATTDTVAFVLARPFWPAYDISFLTDLWDGVTVNYARVFIDSTNGEVTLSWV